jgi:hypothetical protein
VLFANFGQQLKERGYLAMGGQIVDATPVAAPKQHRARIQTLFDQLSGSVEFVFICPMWGASL